MTETATPPPGSAPPATSCSSCAASTSVPSRSSPSPTWATTWSWAVDWFDAFARGNDRPGLVVVEEDGSDQSLTFDELAHRSDQVAVWLRDRGVGKGDAVIVMLGNQVELWETMLAVDQARRGDHAHHDGGRPGRPARPDRARRRAVRGLQPRRRRRSSTTCRATTRASASARSTGGGEWHDLRAAYDLGTVTVEHPGTAPGDRLLLYFTSGTTSRPKLVEHTQVSYPVGHLTDDVLARPAARRRAPQHLLARLGQARLVLLLRAVDRRGDGAGLQLRALRRRPRCSTQLREREVTSFCAPPTVWRMLINADLSGGPGTPARGDRRRRAAQPRGDRAGTPAVGADPARRLRADRDHRADRQHPRARGEARLDGPAAARRAGGAGRPGDGRPRRRCRRGRDLPGRSTGRAAGRCR